jgi:hypothetical protein
LRNFFLSVFLIPAFSLLAQQKVKLHVTFTNNYCGGARPTPEIETKYNTPKDLSHFVLYIGHEKKKGGTKAVTDSLGNCNSALKPGDYYIQVLEIRDKNLFTNFTPSCKKMRTMKYAQLHIEEGKKEYEVNLHFPCNPCQPANRP